MTIIGRLGSRWDRLGRRNALGAILTRDERVQDWDVDEFLATGRADVGRFMRTLSQVAPAVRRTRVLDFGCGVGRVTRALAEHFDAVVGVDVAPSMIAQAQALSAGDSRISFVLNRAPHLRRFATGSFSVVYSRLVLQHIQPSHVRRYISELVRVLEPGGVLMFQLPEHVEGSDPWKSFREAPVEGGAWKRWLPRPAVSAWRWIKFRLILGQPRPLMEMFGLPKDEVLELVRQAGGTILDVVPDASCGEGLSAFEYWVTIEG